MDETYSEPVASLIPIGAPKTPWPDYPAKYGLSQEHIPELIRMAVDESSWEEDQESAGVYRNVHAYRALGQLGAVEAARPLADILKWVDQYSDDWTAEEIPVAFGMMGPAVIPVLDAYLQEDGHGEWARVAAITGLEEILARHPEAQADVVAILIRLLQNHAQNDEYFNASLVYALSKLRLAETYPLVEQVFASENIDLGLMGDWEDFQVEVGLLEKRLTPRPTFNLFGRDEPDGEATVGENSFNKLVTKSKDKKEKKKLKQAKQMRKKNKKKK